MRPFGIASAIAAGWAAGMGLIVVGVPVLLIWALAAHTQSSARRRDASRRADIWLGAHHVGFFTVGGAGGASRCCRSACSSSRSCCCACPTGWAARILRPATLGDAGLLVVATSVIYGLIGGLVAALAGRDARAREPVRGARLVHASSRSSASAWTVVRAVAASADAVVALLPARIRPAAPPGRRRPRRRARRCARS